MKDKPETLAKEPWQMTREEFNKAEWIEGTIILNNRILTVKGKPQLESTFGWKPTEKEVMFANLGIRHRKFVEDALRLGKPVPEEVLTEYPDLAAKLKRKPRKPRSRSHEVKPMDGANLQTCRGLPRVRKKVIMGEASTTIGSMTCTLLTIYAEIKNDLIVVTKFYPDGLTFTKQYPIEDWPETPKLQKRYVRKQHPGAYEEGDTNRAIRRVVNKALKQTGIKPRSKQTCLSGMNPPV